MKPVIISIVLEEENSKADADGNFPACLRIYDPNLKKTKRYRAGIFTRPEKLDKITAELSPLVRRAQDIVDRLRLNNQAFSFEAFERQFKSTGGSITLFTFLEAAANAQAKPANKRTINDLSVLLKKVLEKDVHFGQINHAWLLKLQTALYKHKFTRKKVERTISENTVRLHLRTLRRQYFIAVEEGIAPRLETSPFIGIDTQSVPAKEVKRWLTVKEFQAFRDHEYVVYHPTSKWRDAKALWLMSYYSFGLNMKDILELKWSHFQNDTLIRSRTKTGSPITIKVGSRLKALLEQYRRNKTYVFEHIRPIGDAEEKEKGHDKILGWVTDNVKRIAKQAKISNSETINFYSARHTFAVHYMEQEPNASTFKLMLYLGQTSEQSTRNYLQSLLGNEQVKEVEFMNQL